MSLVEYYSDAFIRVCAIKERYMKERFLYELLDSFDGIVGMIGANHADCHSLITLRRKIIEELRDIIEEKLELIRLPRIEYRNALDKEDSIVWQDDVDEFLNRGSTKLKLK